MPSGLDGNPNPISTPQREQVVGRVAEIIASRHDRQPERPLLVGIDGIDGSGKTTFADELTTRLAAEGRAVVRSTVDSFHNPRAVRWARGKASPVGFYLDSHNLTALQRLLLDPMREGAGARYRVASFDEPSDQPVDDPPESVAGNEILLFDGIFCCRPELLDYWDLTVFLDGQARVDLGRLGYVLADAPAGGTELIDHVLQWVERIDRYASGMRYYLHHDDPMARVDLVIDNNDLGHPFIVESEQPAGKG